MSKASSQLSKKLKLKLERFAHTPKKNELSWQSFAWQFWTGQSAANQGPPPPPSLLKLHKLLTEINIPPAAPTIFTMPCTSCSATNRRDSVGKLWHKDVIPYLYCQICTFRLRMKTETEQVWPCRKCTCFYWSKIKLKIKTVQAMPELYGFSDWERL